MLSRDTVMKFSIIIPAYNAENRIRKTLDSIASQSFTDYELIVVCDSCTDNTEAIAKEYGAITAAVDYHNTGLTRNKGLELASGEWVLFMDDDDWYLHEFVLEELFKQLGTSDCVIFGFVWRGVGIGHPIKIDGTTYPAVWAKAWRRAVIGSTRFPATFPEDVPFTTQVLGKCTNVKMYDVPLYYYNYMRDGSITQDKTDSGELKDFRVCRTSP